MDAEYDECSGSLVGPSPSFSTYSVGSLSEAALRVSGEVEAELESKIGAIDLQSGNDKEHSHSHSNDNDDDFEFVSLIKKPGEVTIGGGWTAPVYPVFDRDLVLGDGLIGDEEADREEDERPIRIPLKSLFMADRDPASCSSSEADELEAIPEGTYCVWTPQTAASPSPSRCKKSNSTGGSCSKRWRFRDLLKRSNSDGKETYVFLTPSSSSCSAKQSTSISLTTPSAKVAEKKAGKVSAHEEFYVRSRAVKEGDKRRSYLPYRKGLVGFFTNVNNDGNGGWGRTTTFPPF